jgi:hypothetical protein
MPSAPPAASLLTMSSPLIRFTCLPEHQSLGSINRVPLKAYASSTNYRHATYAQPKVEPTGISQLPN